MPLAMFDLDDTLCDRAGAFRAWASDFCGGRGLRDETSVEWLIEIDGRGHTPRPELFGLARDRFGIPDTVDELMDGFYRDITSRFFLGPETQDALRRLRDAGWRIGIATNGEPTQELKIRSAGLANFVDGWCVSSLVGSRKPEAGIFRVLADRGGATLEDSWMVGDSADADIAGAHALGISTIWIAHGRAWDRTDLSPTHTADSIPQAVDIILDVS